MKHSFLTRTVSWFSLLALVAQFLVGCGGDSSSGPKAVAKDIDVVALMEQLQSGEKQARFNALIELGDGRENAAPALDMVVDVLKNDKEADVREMAAYVLLQMGESAAKPALEDLKEAFNKEKNPRVKINIVNAWNAIDPDSSPSQGMPKTSP